MNGFCLQKLNYTVTCLQNRGMSSLISKIVSRYCKHSEFVSRIQVNRSHKISLESRLFSDAVAKYNGYHLSNHPSQIQDKRLDKVVESYQSMNLSSFISNLKLLMTCNNTENFPTVLIPMITKITAENPLSEREITKIIYIVSFLSFSIHNSTHRMIIESMIDKIHVKILPVDLLHKLLVGLTKMKYKMKDINHQTANIILTSLPIAFASPTDLSYGQLMVEIISCLGKLKLTYAELTFKEGLTKTAVMLLNNLKAMVTDNMHQIDYAILTFLFIILVRSSNYIWNELA